MTIQQIENTISNLPQSDREFLLNWSEEHQMKSVLYKLLNTDERKTARRLSKIEILGKGSVEGLVTFHLPSHVYSRIH